MFFYDRTYLVINKNTPFQAWKKSPSKISITVLTDIGKHFHFSTEK